MDYNFCILTGISAAGSGFVYKNLFPSEKNNDLLLLASHWIKIIPILIMFEITRWLSML